MHQQKKTSTVAQASSQQNTEAAVKFLRPVSSTSTGDKGPIDKDGDGPSGSDIHHFDIQVGLNGFFVTVDYLDMLEERYVVQTMDEVIELLRKKL